MVSFMPCASSAFGGSAFRPCDLEALDREFEKHRASEMMDKVKYWIEEVVHNVCQTQGESDADVRRQGESDADKDKLDGGKA